MPESESKTYDVFISYAHADAKTEEGKALVESIKEGIEEALKDVLPRKPRYAFLDSEALKWGDEWSTKIRQSISQCRVFVYLLSPNYLLSDYCQREKLWWGREEIRRGRLHKATKPVYYIRLHETGSHIADGYIKECKICQADGAPFFESLEDVKRSIVEDRVRSVSQGIKDMIGNEAKAADSYCTVFPKISEYFVGRLEELAHLNGLCVNKQTIPVISGDAGIGKSELAVAYAYAYAENFPQGRFLVPMEGVTSWNEAMVKLVEKCRSHALDNKADLPSPELLLPEEWDKLPPDEKREAVYRMLKIRAVNGPLLLLLDNLEELNLISDKGMKKLVGDAGLPGNICIIATTRLNEKSASSTSAREFYEIHELKEKDALELFYAMGDNRFSFAKWPFSNGELLLDNVPEEKRPSTEEVVEIKNEYLALKGIIKLLDGHAWSLELVASFMVENFEHYSFQRELEDLQQSRIENLCGQTYRGGIIKQNAEKLLKRTLERVQDFNGIANGLGDHILFLATVAAFFPPDNIPLYALEGIWEQEYGNEKIVYDDGCKKAMTRDFALELLKKYRIVNGTGPVLKMHRLTRDVLLSLKSDDEKILIVKLMQRYWPIYINNHKETLQEIHSWIVWATEWIKRLTKLQYDEEFLHFINEIAILGQEHFLYDDVETLLLQAILYTKKT